MSRTKRSRRWLDRHFRDPYVQQARAAGYRSRAAFKLLELQQRDQLLKPGMRLLDLGAAPGSWSQIAAKQLGRRGQIIALDRLPMEPLPNVQFIQGDFQEETTLQRLRQALGDAPLDLVLSDMAPNLSGTAADQPRMMALCELVLDVSLQFLRPGGSLVLKSFQGEGFDAYLRALRRHFRKVVSRKPKSSRPESRERYLVAKELFPNAQQTRVMP